MGKHREDTAGGDAAVLARGAGKTKDERKGGEAKALAGSAQEVYGSHQGSLQDVDAQQSLPDGAARALGFAQDDGMVARVRG